MPPNKNNSVVCLLRTPSDPDPYTEAFEKAGFTVRQKPLLQFQMVNEELLRQALRKPEAYEGLIVTSPRGAQALERQGDTLHAGWADKPAYVVGPRTAQMVESLGITTVGAASGTGSELASHIVKAVNERPLLFLCGNRRRDELPNRLQRAGVSYEELVVYETHLRRKVDVTVPEIPAWLVFFSPSGVEALSPQRSKLPEGLRIAAIGPTTAGALAKVGYEVEAVAQKPEPGALLEAMLTAGAVGEKR